MFIHESFAFIHELNYVFIRESFAFIREKYDFFPPTKMSSMGFRKNDQTRNNVNRTLRNK